MDMVENRNQNGYPVNITEKQRTISGVAGGIILMLGILGFGKSSFRRALRMTVGSLLILRGATGYCPVTDLMESSGEIPPVEEKAAIA